MKNNKRQTVGTISVDPFNQYEVGVGYVVLPMGVERESYIKQCFANNTISARNEQGTFFKNTMIQDDQLQNVVFPAEPGERGSVLVWNFVPKHNSPIVVAVLNLKDGYGQLTEENQWRAQKSHEGVSASLNLLPKSNKLELEVSVPEGGGELHIKSIGGKLNLVATDQVDVYGANGARLFSKEWINLDITADDLSSVLSQISYEDGEWWIKGDANGAQEPAALGDTLKAKLEDLIDEVSSVLDNIKLITVPTAVGPSGTPLNFAAFDINKVNLATLKSQLSQILSSYVKLD
jgi:hypothetical protein